MLTMAVFDDYPDLLATGSAISLIAGVGPIAIENPSLTESRLGAAQPVRRFQDGSTPYPTSSVPAPSVVKRPGLLCSASHFHPSAS